MIYPLHITFCNVRHVTVEQQIAAEVFPELEKEWLNFLLKETGQTPVESQSVKLFCLYINMSWRKYWRKALRPSTGSKFLPGP